MKKAPILLGLVLFCSACTAPSLRYKKEVCRQIAAGDYQAAEQKLTDERKKHYAEKDATLFYLDRAAVLHDAQNYAASDADLENAQYLTDELYTKSVSASAARLLINDLTTPYYAPAYEQALTYYYRAMNFLAQDNLSAALVEARKAVFFLDHLRADKKKGYNDDPFVQYFASLVFESGGFRDDARIARQNSFNAYDKMGSFLKVSAPHFAVPPNANQLGEVILVHYNGLAPLKKTQSMQLAWGEALAVLNSAEEGTSSLSPEAQNALLAGLSGNAVTLAYPVFEDQPRLVASSAVVADGREYPTQLVSDVSAAAKTDLKEKMPGIMARLASRAVSKQVLAVQARHAAAQAAQDDTVGELAGMLVSALGAAVEKADTRQWFTLPEQIRMSRIFLTPGTHDIKLLFRDGFGNIVGEYTFENVTVGRGKRVFLHYRTAR